MRSALLFSLLSATLLSLSLRPWGSGFLAVAGIMALSIAFAKAKHPWIGAAVGAIAWLGLGVPALEGAFVRLWWSYPALLIVLTLPWAVLGFLHVVLSARLPERSGLLLLPIVLVLAEWLIGQRFLFGDIAGAMLAYTQADTPLRVVAAWSGSSGVVLVLGLLGASLHDLLSSRWSLSVLVLVATVLLVAIPPPGTGEFSAAEGLRIGVVQSALGRFDSLLAHNDFHGALAAIADYEALISKSASAGAELVVLGEQSLPAILDPFKLPEPIGRSLSVAPVVVFGAVEYSATDFYNSAFVWDGLTSEPVYRKRSLVPVVEAPFSRGTSGTPVPLQGALLGLGICLDSVHSEFARQTVAEGAELLIYMTDDAFAGFTTTPHVHSASAALRAAETGRVAVFVNDWGPSAIYGPRGERLSGLGMNERGVITVSVPLLTGITPYVALGNWLGWLCLAVFVAVVTVSLYVDVTSATSTHSRGRTPVNAPLSASTTNVRRPT